MNNVTDTNILREDFDAILNDSRFLEEGESLPYIADNIDDFLREYIRFCQKIARGRQEKIKQLMDTQNISSKECQKMLIEKLKQMMDKCDHELSEDEKDILKWNTPISSYDFSSVPTESVVKKWLSDNDARVPNRMYLYKIAFALGLRAYYPGDIKNDSSAEYLKSANYLFNKIYNQRYCTRNYYELIFIFCLKNGKDYLTAMKMTAKYIKTPKTNDIILNSDNNTLSIIKQGSSDNEDEFIDFLVQKTPLLNDKYSSVFSQLEEIIKHFSDKDVMQDYENKYFVNTCIEIRNLIDYNEEKYSELPYSSYMNLGKKVLISELLKKRLIFFDDRMRISSALYNCALNADTSTILADKFRDLGISQALYKCLKETASESINARFGKESQQYVSDIIRDIIITENDIYNPGFITRTDNGDGTYEYIKKENADISHELIYRNLRTALITAHFFYYWSDTNRDIEPSYEEYLKEIDQLLTDSFYPKMYVKNSFDCFFMLCAKTSEPIDSYYSVFNQIFCIYDDYQRAFISGDVANEFEEYDKYTIANRSAIDISIEKNKLSPVVMSECMHLIDQTEIQEKLLKLIKEIHKKDNNKMQELNISHII